MTRTITPVVISDDTRIANLERENDYLRAEVRRLERAPYAHDDYKSGKARAFTTPVRPDRPDGHPQNPWGKDEV